jgi:hypothetical protein
MSDDNTQRSPQDVTRMAMGEDYKGLIRDELPRAAAAPANGAETGAYPLRR